MEEVIGSNPIRSTNSHLSFRNSQNSVALIRCSAESIYSLLELDLPCTENTVSAAGEMNSNFGLKLAISFLASISFTSPIRASIIAEDTFSYASGEVNNQSDGQGWSGAWSGVISLTEIVQPGAVRINGNHGAALTRALSSTVNLDSVFISFLIRPESNFTSNDFLAVWLDNKTNGDHTAVPNLGIKADQGGTGTLDFMSRFAIGREAYSSIATPGATYLIVGQLLKSVGGTANRYDRFRLWVNPSASEANSWDAQAIINAGSISSFNRVGFRTAYLSPGESALIDDLRIGTSFADVVNSVPEPSAYLLFGSGLALLAGARLRRP